MSECIHLLTAHCTETEFSVKEVEEPTWEQHDYVTTKKDQARQTEPNPPQFSTQVSMSDIHGTRQAMRLKKRSR